MKKGSRNKIIILILILIVIIAAVMILKESTAKEYIDITIDVVDKDNNLSNNSYAIKASQEADGGYSIVLPELVNGKKIKNFIIEKKNIQSDNKVNEIKENILNANETKINAINSITTQNNVSTQVEQLSGEKVYLTKEEISSKKMKISATYDYKSKEEINLYNQNIEKNIEDEAKRKVVITGYMPLEANIVVKQIKEDEVITSIDQYINKKVKLSVAYDIKILYKDKEYQPTDFDENVVVKILGIDEINSSIQKYKVVHVKENTTEEIKEVNINKNVISFSTNEFSIYAILLEETKEDLVNQVSFKSISANIWDGTIATSFAFGEGTSYTPYLISSGAELAYLRDRVNSGTSFDGQYFQLVSDIDLNNNLWTPIGTYTQSFSGVFDGAGYVIANAKIGISALSNSSISSYGLFGSIGNGSNTASIRNLELDNIDIEITYNGNTSSNTSTNKGYSIGIVTGTMFNNSNVTNVIINNSDITDTRTVTLYNNSYRVLVGGVTGFVTNTPTNENAPSGGNGYKIENCYSNTNINLDIALRSSSISYAGQYNVGGIVGLIRSQQVYVSNCLYSGEINATNGFTGPIFGAVRNNTNYTSTSNYSTLWNGNDSGSVWMDTCYYSGYSTNGYAPTGSVNSGNSTFYKNSSTSNIGNVQGVNKGIYTSNKSSRLASFNNYDTYNYTSWKYENNTFHFLKKATAYVIEDEEPTYTIGIVDEYENSYYSYRWYINGSIDYNIQGNNTQINKKFGAETNVKVLVGAGKFYSLAEFTVPELTLYIDFNINNQNNSVIAKLAGTAVPNYINLSDYTYKWYVEDIAGLSAEQIGTGLTLTNLEKGKDYKLVATNNVDASLTRELGFIYGNRQVVYLNYSSGNDNNAGDSPDKPVKNMSKAYEKLESSYSTDENVIVLIGNYSNTSYLNSATASTYKKQATITGIYKGTNYNGILNFESSSSYKYLTEDIAFQYLTFRGNSSGTGASYIYAQGNSLTMGEGLYMENYQTVNTSNGYGTLAGTKNSSPSFHIFCGWYRYNYSDLPKNNSVITIKSGTYARIAGAGSYGTVSDSIIRGQTVSRNITGTASNMYNITINVAIKNSTTDFNNYDYDINLLTGGGASACQYANVVQNINGGKIGRILGGSIGNSGYQPSSWNYPLNSFWGSSKINVNSGEIDEIYGASLGRNTASNSYACDSYFYGEIEINIVGGRINNAVYGGGAGAVVGYSASSSDEYKSYGQSYSTSVTIKVSGGDIYADIYAGGYGYSDYLTTTAKNAVDGGTLYGNSYVNISGGNIHGNVYAGGRGTNSISNRPTLAQLVGNTKIDINGSPYITGDIYGGGMGISGMRDMAKLIGNSTINVASNVRTSVYGGGNVAETDGTTNININSGNNAEIYGGGNVGKVNGNSNIHILGGKTEYIYGGGKSSDINNSYIYLQGGEVNNIYGGANIIGSVDNSNIEGIAGSVQKIYGGNNSGGETGIVNINIKGSSVTDSIYGGGNEAKTTKSNITISKTGNEIPNVYGGGNLADVEETDIKCSGGNILNLYGGANKRGTVNLSNITLSGGNISYVYGGNNEGGTTINTNIETNGGNINQAIYGGGKQTDTQNSYIKINNVSNNVPYIFGGGQLGGVNKTELNINGGKAQNIFGGSNMDGTVTTSKVTVAGGDIVNVYGGNNSGGITTDTFVIIENGNPQNVYGGGNEARTLRTNVEIKGKVLNSVYGGGNSAEVVYDTNLNIINANVGNNVYGGGNEGTVGQNTYVHVKDSNLLNSIYGGGNGITAIVEGNTNLTIEGTNTKITKHVFGGGNQAATGREETNASTSTVNITGATIGGNVYGGANTSVVYGNAELNLGYDEVNNELLEIGNIDISGTVFGGGEANEAGSEVYDFSFISVTKGIDININGNNHSVFNIKGSIFGSGNASSASGISNINILNYGTASSPKKNISIQRATNVVLNNSAMALSGATDRTNEYSNVYFSLSRIEEIKIKNNSTLYLNCGANLVKRFLSLLDENGTEVKATVSINQETGETVKNVDNRLYMLEGKNLNIATNEQVTAYGEIFGMTFFGIYTNTMNPSTSTGLYNSTYDNGDKIINEGTFATNSYVLGQHKVNHNTNEDGFYSNYNEDGYIKSQYIETTPDEDVYYIWSVGEQTDVTVFELTLTGSKYATLGTYELPLTGFATPNIKLILTGFSAGLEGDISLIEPKDIEPIAKTEEQANSQFGLSMKTGNNGWQTRNANNFLTKDGGTYTGANSYSSDNSYFTPSLTFCFYHSGNISVAKRLGEVALRFQVLTPVDDITYQISYIDIRVTLATALYQDDFYEAAITPGEQFELFATTETNITDRSIFSTYYSLLIPKFSESRYYQNYTTYSRALVSRDKNNGPFVFKEGTKLTMIDSVSNKHYYYVVSAEDVLNNKYIYYLQDFKAMGSTNELYNKQTANSLYYNSEQDLLYENFIFHVDFLESDIPSDVNNNTLLMELRDNENQTLVGVLGIQRDSMVYSVYKNRQALIDLNVTANKQSIYLGDELDLTVKTNFTQNIVQSKIIYDTKYFSEQMGLKITIFDNNNNRLNIDSLLGVTFKLNGTTYYPDVNGNIRIKIADVVSNVLSNIKVNTANNTTLATGTYKIKIESFGSPDGLYYGLESSDIEEIPITIINSGYGLKVSTDNQTKIIDKDTGKTLHGNNSLVTLIEYSSGFDNPNIAVSLYRRDYTSIYSQKYNLVDLKEYVSNNLVKTSRNLEYISIERSPAARNTSFLNLKEKLISGTYKLVFKLYDKNEYIAEAYDYLIIK